METVGKICKGTHGRGWTIWCHFGWGGEGLLPKTRVRQPGVEPGSTAWKATMLTVTPLTLDRDSCWFSRNRSEEALQNNLCAIWFSAALLEMGERKS